MPRLDALAPVLRVADLPASLGFYIERLGFRMDFVWGDPPGYVCLSRDGICLHLSSYAGSTAGVVCFFCEGIDALYEDFGARGAPVGRPPADQPYGMREFEFEDPDGHRLVFGEAAPVAGR